MLEDALKLEQKIMSLPEWALDKIALLQQKDIFYNNILSHLHCNPHGGYFTDSIRILHKKVINFNSTFSSEAVPKVLIKYPLHTLYNSLGHMGATKLYHFIKRFYYFLNMRKTIHKYVKTCKNCQIINLQKPKLYNLTPGNSINTTRSLISWPHWPLQYNHTRQHIHLHSNLQLHRIPHDNPYFWQKDFNNSCLLFSKIFLKFGFPRILHSDNGTEFKLKLIEHLMQQLGIKKMDIPPHHPQSNGKLESTYRFINGLYLKNFPSMVF